jgi:outer membrane immunogenic protein
MRQCDAASRVLCTGRKSGLGVVLQKLIFASVACIALLAAGAAMAADLSLPTRKAPIAAPAAAPNWSGFYIGGNFGAGRDQNDATVTGASTDPALDPFLAFFLAAGAVPTSPSAAADGGFGGGQIGYNWQIDPHWVLGAETDFEWSRIKGSDSQTPTPFGFDLATWSVSKKLDWFGTVRARAGFLVDPSVMFYATGGYAYGRTTMSYSTADITNGCLANAFICGAASSSGISNGWTAGGGVEAMLTQHLTMKAEYLYVDLGGRTVNDPTNTPLVFSASSQFHEQTVRVGLNYLFN